MNFSELIELNLAPEQQVFTCPLKGEDALAALRHGLEAFGTEHTFKSGDLVRQKDGMASMSCIGERDEGANPGIFIRYDAQAGDLYGKPEHGTPYILAMVDCLVGWINSQGGFVVSATCSIMFEPA